MHPLLVRPDQVGGLLSAICCSTLRLNLDVAVAVCLVYTGSSITIDVARPL